MEEEEIHIKKELIEDPLSLEIKQEVEESEIKIEDSDHFEVEEHILGESCDSIPAPEDKSLLEFAELVNSKSKKRTRGGFRCGICKQSHKNITELSQHLESHADHKCEICKIFVTSASNLLIHKERYHREENKSSDPVTRSESPESPKPTNEASLPKIVDITGDTPKEKPPQSQADSSKMQLYNRLNPVESRKPTNETNLSKSVDITGDTTKEKLPQSQPGSLKMQLNNSSNPVTRSESPKPTNEASLPKIVDITGDTPKEKPPQSQADSSKMQLYNRFIIASTTIKDQCAADLVKESTDTATEQENSNVSKDVIKKEIESDIEENDLILPLFSVFIKEEKNENFEIKEEVIDINETADSEVSNFIHETNLAEHGNTIVDTGKKLLLSHNDSMYMCNICKEFFPNELQVKLHMNSHIKSTNYKRNCDNTDKEQQTSESGAVMKFSHMCAICKKLFENEAEVKKHIISHVEAKQKMCKQGDPSSSSDPADYNNDSCKIRKHSLSTLVYLKCDFCETYFVDKPNLDQHMKLHTQNSYIISTGSIIKNKDKSNFIHETNLTETTLADTGNKLLLSHNGSVYMCNICKEFFPSELEVKLHMNSHIKSKTYKRKYCDNTDKEQQTSQSGAVKKLSHMCAICKKLFENEAEVKKHIISHVEAKQQMSKQGDPSSSSDPADYNNDSCKIRKQSFVTQVYLKCNYCNTYFIDKSNLDQHMKLHTQNNYIISTGSVTKNKDSSNLTLLVVNRNTNEVMTGNTGMEQPPSIQNYISNIPSTLQNSQLHAKNISNIPSALQNSQLHAKNLLFKCVFCDKWFLNQTNLARHLKSHIKVNIHKCTICEKSFPIKSILLTHMKTHVESKLEKCEYCNKLFIEKKSLNEHMSLHTENISYNCNICNTTFLNKSLLTEHLNMHMETVRSELENDFEMDTEEIINNNGKEKSTPLTDSINQLSQLYNIHKCDICKKLFAYDSEIKLHMTVHVKPYKCKHCDKSFSSPSGLVHHAQTECQTCDICNKIFPKRYLLKKHKKSHINYLNCDVCDSLFDSILSLNNHLKLHTESFKCCICNKMFLRKVDLMKHLDYHIDSSLQHEKSNLMEDIGNDELANDIDLSEPEIEDAHKEQLADPTNKPEQIDNVYKCEQCNEFFKLKSVFRKHMNMHLRKPYKCMICDKSYHGKSDLIQHLTTHEYFKPYRCYNCGKPFRKKINYDNHLLMIQLNKCDICNKSFCSRFELNKHSQIHEEHKCYMCKKRFNSERLLKKHEESHKKYQEFACDICSISFFKKNNLIEHVSQHANHQTKDKPFECDICKKTFSNKFNLTLHIKTHV